MSRREEPRARQEVRRGSRGPASPPESLFCKQDMQIVKRGECVKKGGEAKEALRPLLRVLFLKSCVSMSVEGVVSHVLLDQDIQSVTS